MVRLIHVTDIHFGCENKPAVDAVGELIREGGFDAVVQSGDITLAGTEPEFRAAADWLKSLPGPIISTPGNHDTPEYDVLTRMLKPWDLYERYIGPADHDGLEAPGLNIQTMNTARGIQLRLNWSKGAVSHDDPRDICRRLSRARPGALRIAVCHHPLMEITGGPMTGRVRGGTEAARVIAEGASADLILTGHVHTPFAHPLPFGDGRTYAVGAATLSRRERGAPAGYGVIEADDREIRVTAMGWTGAKFETQRSWGFTRRGADPAPPQEAGGTSPAPAGN
jgi:3',5'-cyclic AMP phosphodiesterase CpdA